MSLSADLVVSMLTLLREGRTGVATIQCEGVKTFVYLRDGEIVFAEEGSQGETLGRLLVRQQLLKQEHYVEIIAKMTDALVLNEQLRFGEVAIELGYLTEEEVAKALGDQIRWKIVRAFQRGGANWEFEDSQSRVDDAGNFPMPMESLVLEALRWVDDDEKLELGLARALDRRLCIAPEAAATLGERFGLSVSEEAFARRLDGTRTVAELLASESVEGVDTHAIVTALIVVRVAVLATAPQRAPAAAPAPAAAIVVPPAAIPAAPPAAAPSARKATRMPGTRASQILEALGAQRVKVDLRRTGANDHETRLLAERAFQSGLEHMKSGRYQLAATDLQQASRLLPTSFEYRLYEKWCTIRGRGEPPHAIDLAELRRLATAALTNDPNLAFACCVTGELALGEGNDKVALRMLRRAERLDPELLEAQRLIRVVERRLAKGKG